ncbi:MAG TPA: hypothetical protein VLB90_09145 [Pseudomonadales bacterium]|nr:hypothetical protein [Pseudomonadales bacterium]
MMNESLRLDYLEAMGITQYVARMPLPGARPSPVIHIATMPEQPSRITELLDEHIPAAKKLPAASSSPVSVPATPAPTLAVVFQCQIAIWTVADLLILADTPRFDNNQMTLLRNILQAIGRKETLSDAKQFSWPLPQRKDKSVQAAKEHFQGLLDGGLLQTNGLRQILCFGDSVSALLKSSEIESENVQQYQDWPVVTVCALHEMLTQPSRKAGTWRTLQTLIRV